MPDVVQQRDDIAEAMREFYEANKPLRWWQRRKPAAYSCIADDLMLGLLSVAQTGLAKINVD